MTSETFEFDVVMKVRKRIHVSGPANKEVAREMLKGALEGGMNPNIFAKRGKDGHPIEQIMSNDFVIVEVSS